MPETINVTEELAKIRASIETRLSRTVPEIPELALPPLEPLRQARAVAEGWSGNFGLVNPRRPGLLNNLAQAVKKLQARALRWYTFPQTQFNSATVAALLRVEEMFADTNRNLVVMGQAVGQIKESGSGTQGDSAPEKQEQAKRLTEMEARIEALNAAVLEANREREAAIEKLSNHLRLSVEDIHGNVSRGLSDGLMRTREEVGAEIRLVRQRMAALTAADSVAPAPAPSSTSAFDSPGAPASSGQESAPPSFDYSHFEDRFRGSEKDVRDKLTAYLPLLRDRAPVLDVACGRGEMLALLRENQIAASGVDLDPDMVESCKAKGGGASRSAELPGIAAGGIAGRDLFLPVC